MNEIRYVLTQDEVNAVFYLLSILNLSDLSKGRVSALKDLDTGEPEVLDSEIGKTLYYMYYKEDFRLG